MASFYNKTENCRICGGTSLSSILSLGEQALTGVFPKSIEQNITKGPLDLVRCTNHEGCGLVQLSHSYSHEEMYGDNYGYRSGLNSSMIAHLKLIHEEILSRNILKKGDLVLDIGSNDGTFLSFYDSKFSRIGMDPTNEKFKQYYATDIVRVPKFFTYDHFSKETGNRKAKVITSIAMFYDLERPLDFVRDIKLSLDAEGIWVFEQSYLPTMLEKNAYDTICHEHLEYYGLEQIIFMLEKNEMQVVDMTLNDSNGGSLRVTASHKNNSRFAQVKHLDDFLEKEKECLSELKFKEFESRIESHRKDLLESLYKIKSQNKKVIGYGASTKGNVILQYCNIDKELLPYIAEVNPEKYGSYTPLTNIPIISESDALAMNPDYYLVLPWHFKDNFLEKENKFLKNGGKFIFPLPHLDIVGLSE